MNGKPRKSGQVQERVTAAGAQAASLAPRHGFSILELDRAGISESLAHALGLPIDGTRHDALLNNVRRLKGWAGK